MKHTLIFGNIITMDEKRPFAKGMLDGADTRHNVKGAITRKQSLRALTINVAHAWHQEHRLGSIEFGKEVYKA